MEMLMLPACSPPSLPLCSPDGASTLEEANAFATQVKGAEIIQVHASRMVPSIYHLHSRGREEVTIKHLQGRHKNDWRWVIKQGRHNWRRHSRLRQATERHMIRSASGRMIK
ncbi:unnamed protein product [Amoebophrya sp. A25]|nr:unnamed protein product [Amoebophrya sp. A25]|eukprot:GSA25T00010124001.1